MSIIETQRVAIHLNCVKFVIIMTSGHSDVDQKRFFRSPELCVWYHTYPRSNNLTLKSIINISGLN